MEYVLIILGLLCCIVGIIGSVVPVLPGLPISWVGLLLIYFCKEMTFDYWFLGITLGVTILMTILSYVIPAKGTKRYGGSRAGAIGTTIGLFAGLFFPFGILLGPFLGAFIGEFFFNGSESKVALRAAWGSFIGFLAGVFMNVMVALIFLGLFIYKVWENSDIIFS
ncbi:MAG TPA: DUF456 domain-containing protein [Edaphocola sp.]|nr:DUF456 domain-containing protein [Edaphocola sp.]